MDRYMDIDDLGGNNYFTAEDMEYNDFLGKKYKDWKKYSRSVLENRVKKFRKEKTRTILQAWLKAHKVWKVQKDKENFERAVKAEI